MIRNTMLLIAAIVAMTGTLGGTTAIFAATVEAPAVLFA